MLNGGDFSSLDWGDVAISTAVGAIAPGILTSGSKVYKSFKAAKTLGNQLNRAQTVNKQQKLVGRIGRHNSIIKTQVATQAAWQTGKFLGKQAIDYPTNSNNGK